MAILKDNVQTVTAFAPATCANVAVGFDILGFACDHLGDTVTLTLRKDKQIVIDAIDSRESLPFDISKNTASIVIKNMVEKLQLGVGLTLHIKKGIPLSSGLGGSAASAVAAAVACNAFLARPLSKQELVQYALVGETEASGHAHADNIAPCVYGGLTLVHSLNPIEIVSLPIPDVYCVLVHPHLYVNTKEARKILSKNILLTDYVKQSSQLAGFVAALYKKDKALLKKSLTDFIVEPQRAQFIPAFYELKALALEKGALGMSISGSGPTMFVLAEDKENADTIGQIICGRLRQENIETDCFVTRINANGANRVN